jgi:hypothetical protein
MGAVFQRAVEPLARQRRQRRGAAQGRLRFVVRLAAARPSREHPAQQWPQQEIMADELGDWLMHARSCGMTAS